MKSFNTQIKIGSLLSIGKPFHDLSLHSLFLINFITIFFALTEGWQLSTVMWIYWFQSMTIGFFNFVRILCLQKFSTDGYSLNGQPAKPTKYTKFFTAFFFIGHFSFFHLIYAMFLLTGTDGKLFSLVGNPLEWNFIIPTTLLFFVNHLFSYIYNRRQEIKNINIGILMFYPYVRIVPMHLTILLGALFGSIALPFFLILKTVSDALMHIVEHAIARK